MQDQERDQDRAQQDQNPLRGQKQGKIFPQIISIILDPVLNQKVYLIQNLKRNSLQTKLLALIPQFFSPLLILFHFAFPTVRYGCGCKNSLFPISVVPHLQSLSNKLAKLKKKLIIVARFFPTRNHLKLYFPILSLEISFDT